ncbi:hypothetical protein [Nonomuraea sp. NPDC001023]|uniref:hypothetical protein n=1 Tax=unclassified Nonomuraea TaxID=2593643 RepID=UPI0033329857
MADEHDDTAEVRGALLPAEAGPRQPQADIARPGGLLAGDPVALDEERLLGALQSTLVVPATRLDASEREVACCTGEGCITSAAYLQGSSADRLGKDGDRLSNCR